MSESNAEQTSAPGSITLLLQQVSAREHNDVEQVERLYARIESQFRWMAKRLLSGHRADRSPPQTEVIDEIFLKLIEPNKFNWNDRRHFLRTAAVSMRRWIASYYRSLDADKRRIDRDAVPLSGDVLADVSTGSPAQIVELSDLCDRLWQSHPRAMEALDLWAFSGWTQEEVAAIMELPLRTVQQLIALAKRLVEKAIQNE